MKSIKAILLAVLFYIPGVWAADPADLNIKYSSNYLMPAYVHFQSDGFEYTIKATLMCRYTISSSPPKAHKVAIFSIC